MSSPASAVKYMSETNGLQQTAVNAS